MTKKSIIPVVIAFKLISASVPLALFKGTSGPFTSRSLSLSHVVLQEFCSPPELSQVKGDFSGGARKLESP